MMLPQYRYSKIPKVEKEAEEREKGYTEAEAEVEGGGGGGSGGPEKPKGAAKPFIEARVRVVITRLQFLCIVSSWLLGYLLWSRSSYSEAWLLLPGWLDPKPSSTLATATATATMDLPYDWELDFSTAPIGELVEVHCWPNTDDRPNPKSTRCYRMAAPLDYLNTTHDDRRASIAMIRYLAGNGDTPRAKVLGTVFFNPGGPGGSGIDFISSVSPSRRNTTGFQYFDYVFQGRYDLVSFDPRGVKRTWPRADCFDNNTNTGYVAETYDAGVGLYHSSSAALANMQARSQFEAALCKDRLGDELQYVTTPSVVEDLRLMYRAVNDSALHYAGFSYGTVIASYFADMYPGEVGHLWADGVVDASDYQSGSWEKNLVDTPHVLQGFYTSCANAGPGNCALSAALLSDQQRAESKDKGASILSSAVSSLLESVRRRPVPVTSSEVKLPQLLTYRMLKETIFDKLYSPSSWPELATNLADGMARGNWTGFVNAYGLKAPEPAQGSRHTQGGKGSGKPRQPTYHSSQAMSAIAGSDSLSISSSHHGSDGSNDEDDDDDDDDDILSSIQHSIESMESLTTPPSTVAAELWAHIGLTCSRTWQIPGKYRWRGNFTSSRLRRPVLFTSMEYDPVTPLVEARKMASSFSSSQSGGVQSGLMWVQGGLGHCTIAQPSTCALDVVAKYFLEDKVPGSDNERGEKICTIDRPAFIPAPTSGGNAEVGTLKMEDVAEGLAELFAQNW